MSSRRNGWRTYRLDDPKLGISIQPGFACGKKDVDGGVPHLRMNNISSDGLAVFSLVRRIPPNIAEQKNRWLEANDILFCNTNSTDLVGKTCQFRGWEERCTFSNHLTRLRVESDRMIPEWLSFCLRHLWLNRYFAIHCTEFIGQSSFNKDKLKEITIPVPPLEEQHRIVARIEALTHRADQARRLRQEAIKGSSHSLPIAYLSAYRELSEQFETVPLAKTGYISGGGTPSRKNEAYWQGDIPWISAKNMKSWRIAKSTENITSEAIAKSSAKLIPSPAVLFVVRGMILLRKIPVAISDCPLAINQDMKAIVPNKDFNAEYLASMLLGAESLVLGRVGTAGHGTKKLEPRIWKNIRIPKPSSIAEQRRIAGRLDAIRAKADALTRLQTEADADLAAFTPALLAKAFRGEL